MSATKSKKKKILLLLDTKKLDLKIILHPETRPTYILMLVGTHTHI